MKLLVTGVIALTTILCASHGAFAQSAPGKEWSRSGFGGSVTYRCKLDSCGGVKSKVRAARFGGISEVPELGIPSGTNVEAEFRRRPEVRRILGAMLQQLMRESAEKGSRLSTSYFAKPDHVGISLTAFDSKSNTHMFAQLRISNNVAHFISSEAESAALAKRNFLAVAPAIKAK